MPLCGLKKNKQQKRDPSPPYRQPEAAALGEVDEKLRQKNEELSDNFKSLQNDLRQSNAERHRLEDQVASLKSQLEEAAKAAPEKVVTEVKAGAGSLLSGGGGLFGNVEKNVSSELKEHEEKLQKVQAEIEEQQIQKRAIEGVKTKLESELQEVTQSLEKTKKEADDKVQKMGLELERVRGEADKALEEKEKLKKEKDLIENTLSHTTKELDIARKESHIPRSPTRAPSEEWKNKIETAEAELNKERQQRLDRERENSRLNSDKELLVEEQKRLQTELEELKSRQLDEVDSVNTEVTMTYKNDVRRLEETLEDYRRRLEQTESEKEELLNRLSRVTQAAVLDNNPDIADLDDPNRPQKLGEHLTQLYDNQWTDAYDSIEKLDMNEEDIIKTLLNLLTSVYQHCCEASETQMSRIEEDLFLPPLEAAQTAVPGDTNGTDPLKSPTGHSKHSMSKIPRFTSHKGRPALPNLAGEKKSSETDTPNKDKTKRSLSSLKMKGDHLPEVPVEVRRGIKEYRKKITKQVWPVIEKEVLNKMRKNEEFGDQIVDTCKPYISRCVELCWLMRVQDPPVCLNWKAPDDNSFDHDVYRAYTQTGPSVLFVVWPAIYLHEGGPVLMKGVAQCGPS